MVKDMKKHALLVIIALLFRIGQAACEISIAVNQVGYFPEAPSCSDGKICGPLRGVRSTGSMARTRC